MPSQKSFPRLMLSALFTVALTSVGSVAYSQSPFYYPSASFFSPTANYYQSDDVADLATILKDDNFATFNTNLQTAKLSTVLKQEKVMTVLAPTEEAFAALSPDLQQKLSKPELLEKVLKYHLIIGKITDKDIQRREVSTLLEQNSVQIMGILGEKKEVTIQLNDSVASEPLPAANGVIIPIDQVLIPPNF